MNEEDIDLNSIQEENLAMLQKSIEDFNTLNIQNDSEIPESKETTIPETILQVAKEQELNIQEDNDLVLASEVQKNSWLRDMNYNILWKIVWTLRFFVKYMITASFIFVVLMACTNYSAYITIAKSYLNPELIAESEKTMNSSMAASQITVAKKTPTAIGTGATQEVKAEEKLEDYNSKDIRNIVWDIRNENINLDIEIIPFVNRVVIPKIGKNIPLVDIEKGKVEWLDELNDIFMSELEGGVVRYPGSAKPWEYGNSFIFWHSSNFPWVAGDYNDVFALLDRLEIWDEVVSYYEWKKYTYKIHEKKVISPNDVSVLKRDTGKKEITLMTCWPIGTTYNRLLLIWELVK